MIGHFRKVGKAPFFGGSAMPCDVYEWTSKKLKRLEPLKIRFLAVDGPGRRRYWMEPLWHALEKGEP